MTINEVYLLNRYLKPLQEEIERLTNENEQLKSKVMACECCGKKTKYLDCHHKDPENYTDLTTEKFALLCKSCHSCVSDVERIKPENREKLRSKEYLKLFGKFVLNKEEKKDG